MDLKQYAKEPGMGEERQRRLECKGLCLAAPEHREDPGLCGWRKTGWTRCASRHANPGRSPNCASWLASVESQPATTRLLLPHSSPFEWRTFLAWSYAVSAHPGGSH